MERHLLDKYRQLELSHWWFRVREGILSDTVSQLTRGEQGQRILNVGAATGRSTEFLLPFGQVNSVEYDEPSYVYCRDVLKLDIIQASITDLPFPNDAFDLVCSMDVVEHVEDHARAIHELVRVCRPGGKILVTVPAFMSLWSDHDRVNHHFRRYRMREMEELFRPYPGATIRKSYFNTLLFPPIWLTRRLSRFRPRTSDAELKPDNEFMQSPLTDRIFGAIFGLERHLLRMIDFPFGVSLIVVWRKAPA